MELKTNVGNSKVLMVKKDQRTDCEGEWGGNGRNVEKFIYMGVMMNSDGNGVGKGTQRLREGRKVWKDGRSTTNKKGAV